MSHKHQKRHTCIICKSKRYEVYMISTGAGWACRDSIFRSFDYGCESHSDIEKIIRIHELVSQLEVLNGSYI